MMKVPLGVCPGEIAPGSPVLEIAHPTCTARVALHGAYVMSWKPMDDEEVLYLSPDAVFKNGKAIRGGNGGGGGGSGSHAGIEERFRGAHRSLGGAAYLTRCFRHRAGEGCEPGGMRPSGHGW